MRNNLLLLLKLSILKWEDWIILIITVIRMKMVMMMIIRRLKKSEKLDFSLSKSFMKFSCFEVNIIQNNSTLENNKKEAI